MGRTLATPPGPGPPSGRPPDPGVATALPGSRPPQPGSAMTLRIAAFTLLCGTAGCRLWTMTSDEPGSNPAPWGETAPTAPTA